MDENYLDLFFGSTLVLVLFLEEEESDSLFMLSQLSAIIGMQGHFIFHDPSASLISAAMDDSCLLAGMASISTVTDDSYLQAGTASILAGTDIGTASVSEVTHS